MSCSELDGAGNGVNNKIYFLVNSAFVFLLNVCSFVNELKAFVCDNKKQKKKKQRKKHKNK